MTTMWCLNSPLPVHHIHCLTSRCSFYPFSTHCQLTRTLSYAGYHTHTTHAKQLICIKLQEHAYHTSSTLWWKATEVSRSILLPSNCTLRSFQASSKESAILPYGLLPSSSVGLTCSDLIIWMSSATSFSLS